jgi:hypothetical protein
MASQSMSIQQNTFLWLKSIMKKEKLSSATEAIEFLKTVYESKS